MARKSVKQCIDIVLACIEERKCVDYANPLSVRRFNAAYDRCANNMLYIDKHYPNEIDVVMELLNHSDYDVVLHCAPIILRFKNCSALYKWKAIDRIKEVLRTHDISKADRLGWELSLRNWEQNLRKSEKAGDGCV